jgi:hypothetical protein
VGKLVAPISRSRVFSPSRKSSLPLTHEKRKDRNPQTPSSDIRVDSMIFRMTVRVSLGDRFKLRRALNRALRMTGKTLGSEIRLCTDIKVVIFLLNAHTECLIEDAPLALPEVAMSRDGAVLAPGLPQRHEVFF